MLTFTEIENHCQYMLEGETTLPNGVTIAQVIDQAGRFFYNHHSWNFRDGNTETVDLVADQAYIEMPMDLQGLQGVEMTNALTSGIALVTMRELMRRRSTSVTVKQSYYWAALVRPRRRSRALDYPQPRLEIWPTPVSTSLNAVTILYKTRWPAFADTTADTSTDTAPIPEYCEMAFLEVLRAIVAGWGERLTQPQGGVTGLLKLVCEGYAMQAAKDEDGNEQYTYGPLIGGGIQTIYPLTELFSTSASSGDPSS
jgi:hypothetical protein